MNVVRSSGRWHWIEVQSEVSLLTESAYQGQSHPRQMKAFQNEQRLPIHFDLGPGVSEPVISYLHLLVKLDL